MPNSSFYRLTAEKFLKSAIFWGAISSLLVLVLVKIGLTTPAVFAIKDGVVYLLALVFIRTWLRSWTSYAGIVIVISFSLFLLVNHQLLNQDYSAALYNIRQLVAPLILLLVFCSIRLDSEKSSELVMFLSNAVIMVVAFGAIEQFFEIWKRINLSTYFALKNIPTDAFGMSFMFYEPAFGNRERMTSTFIDPISAGHFFASAAIFLLYAEHKSKRRHIALVLALVGLFFTLSKGALLQFFIGSFLLNFRINILIRMVSIAVPYLFYMLLPEKGGVQIHLIGLTRALDSISLWGHGIGSAGNYATMFSLDGTSSNELGIGDTFVGAMIGQIGILGSLIWLSIALLFIFWGRTFWGGRRAYITFISIYTVSILSENTMNVTSFLIPAVIIGMSRSSISSVGLRKLNQPNFQRKILV